ncbi:MAG: hypothetical protein EOO40_00820 [Deltaproteobacteria bacterium]|nr:MAG: hypothetical protein EOO40_00820 [Deltaproteobacteria bacterium]
MTTRRREVVFNKQSQVTANKDKGAHFEAVLQHRAGVTGFLAIRQHLSFRYLRKDKIQPIRAELDFSIVRRDGKIVYVDCKCFDTQRLQRSQLNPFQVKRALKYNHWGVPSGLVVHFTSLGVVVFYTGLQLSKMVLGTSLAPGDGIKLGCPSTFDLEPIFASPVGI